MSIKAPPKLRVGMPVRVVPFGANSTPLQSNAGFNPLSFGPKFPNSTRTRPWSAGGRGRGNHSSRGQGQGQGQFKRQNSSKGQNQQKAKKQKPQKKKDPLASETTLFNFMDRIAFRAFSVVSNTPNHLIMRPSLLLNKISIFTNHVVHLRVGTNVSGTRIKLAVEFAKEIFRKCIQIIDTKYPLAVKKELKQLLEAKYSDKISEIKNNQIAILCAKHHVEKAVYDEADYDRYFNEQYETMKRLLTLDFTAVLACFDKTLDASALEAVTTIEGIANHAKALYANKAHEHIRKNDVKLTKPSNESEVVQAACVRAFYELVLAQLCDIHNVVIRALMTVGRYFHMEDMTTKLATSFFNHTLSIINNNGVSTTDVQVLMGCLYDIHAEATKKVSNDLKSKLTSKFEETVGIGHKFSEIADPDFERSDNKKTSMYRHGISREAIKKLHAILELHLERTYDLSTAQSHKINAEDRTDNSIKLEKKNIPQLAIRINSRKVFFTDNPEYKQMYDFRFHRNLVTNLGQDLLSRTKNDTYRSHLLYHLDKFNVPVKANLKPLQNLPGEQIEEVIASIKTKMNPLKIILDGNSPQNYELETVDEIAKLARDFNDLAVVRLMHALETNDKLAKNSKMIDYFDSLYVYSVGVDKQLIKEAGFLRFIQSILAGHYGFSNFTGFISEVSQFEREYENKMLAINVMKSYEEFHDLMTNHINAFNIKKKAEDDDEDMDRSETASTATTDTEMDEAQEVANEMDKALTNYNEKVEQYNAYCSSITNEDGTFTPDTRCQEVWNEISELKQLLDQEHGKIAGIDTHNNAKIEQIKGSAETRFQGRGHPTHTMKRPASARASRRPATPSMAPPQAEGGPGT
jgi:hypothetical protein